MNQDIQEGFSGKTRSFFSTRNRQDISRCWSPMFILLAFFAVSISSYAASGPIKSSPNGHFFLTSEGNPFYFLADTQWELFRRFSIGDAKIILEDRKAKGFTVIMVMLTGVGPGIEPNQSGQRAWLNNNPSTPNPAYFDHVDAVVKLAEQNDLQLLIGIYHQTYGTRMNVDNARPWAAWVTSRYRERPNIIWTLYAKANESSRTLISEIAAGIQDGDTGRHLISMHPDPSPASSSFMHNEPWLGFNSIQVWKDLHLIYPMTFQDYSKSPPKPVAMLEGAYEKGEEYGFPITPFLVRRQAYYTCLAGGFFGYGHNDSWRVKPGWRQALDDPGAKQMTILKSTLTALPQWWTLIPDQTIFNQGGNSQGATLNLAARSDTGRWLLCYIAGQPKINLNMSKLPGGGKASASWVNPVNGERLALGAIEISGIRDFNRPASWEDALLIITAIQ